MKFLFLCKIYNTSINVTRNLYIIPYITGKSSSGCQHAVTKIPQQFSNLSAAVLLQLSPALRNRFTEIWCPPSNARADLIQIIEHNIKPGVVLKSASHGMTLLIIQ